MRPPHSLFRLNSSLPARHVLIKHASYSTSTPTPLVNVRSIPAPHTGTIRILSLNRPKSRNAISRQLLAELLHQITDIKSEGANGRTRALILASDTDDAFCAGADLKERSGFTEEETEAFLSSLRGALNSLSTLPIPTLSAVASTALGGGLELALATTFRIFTSHASVALPETRLGIIPGAGGTYRLPRLVGPTRALDLILTGRRVSGLDAFRMGVCDRLVLISEEDAAMPGCAREKALDEAVQMARLICEGAPRAVGAAREAVLAAEEKVENEMYDSVVRTEDRNEALRAFREKRKPIFKGR